MTIQSLWTHGSLSTMERLCLSSFLKNGHDVHLYTYEDVQGVPAGVKVMDGNDIIPRSMYDYKKFINNGTFADFFRYKLLLDRGGWWVDTDLICLKPFTFPTQYVFGRMGPWVSKPAGAEAPRRALRSLRPTVNTVLEPGPVCNNCMFSTVLSDVMRYCWNKCRTFDPSKIKWSVEVGPMLLNDAVRRHNLLKYVRDTNAFNPVDHQRVRDFIDPNVKWNFGDDTYAVHLWQDLWTGRTNWEDKPTWEITGCPPIIQSKESVVPGSLYGELVKRYL